MEKNLGHCSTDSLCLRDELVENDQCGETDGFAATCIDVHRKLASTADIGELEYVTGDDGEVETKKEVFGNLCGVRLLLAEDTGTNHQFIGSMLEQIGCAVDRVGTGKKVLDRISARNYDAILMDVSMPKLDAIAATKLIRQFRNDVRKIPIIALTANVFDKDRDRFLAAGINDFLVKPVAKFELVWAIEQHVFAIELMGCDPAPPIQITQNLVDQSVLADIFADMDVDTASNILTLFEKDVQRHLSDLKDATSTGNEKQFERATHGLKGVTGTFGATELSQMSSKANELMRSGKMSEAFPMSEEIQSLCIATMMQVQQRFEPGGNIKKENVP